MCCAGRTVADEGCQLSSLQWQMAMKCSGYDLIFLLNAICSLDREFQFPLWRVNLPRVIDITDCNAAMVGAY